MGADACCSIVKEQVNYHNNLTAHHPRGLIMNVARGILHQYAVQYNNGIEIAFKYVFMIYRINQNLILKAAEHGDDHINSFLIKWFYS